MEEAIRTLAHLDQRIKEVMEKWPGREFFTLNFEIHLAGEVHVRHGKLVSGSVRDLSQDDVAISLSFKEG